MLAHILINGAAVAAVLGFANFTTIDGQLLRFPSRKRSDDDLPRV